MKTFLKITLGILAILIIAMFIIGKKYHFEKSIVINALVNNIFDVDYISNGADYGGGYVYYYPQAGINFLAGLTLKF